MWLRIVVGAGQRGADIDMGRLVLDDMMSSGRPPDPRQFEFWFNYRAGKYPALIAAADEIVAARGDLFDRDIDALYERYLSPWRFGEDCDTLASRFSDRLDDLTIALDDA